QSDETTVLGVGIVFTGLELLGVYPFLETLIESQRTNDRCFGAETEQPDGGFAKPQNEESRCGQCVQRDSPQPWDVYAHKKGRFDVAPHSLIGFQLAQSRVLYFLLVTKCKNGCLPLERGRSLPLWPAPACWGRW